MKKLCVNFTASVLSLWVVSELMDSMTITSFKSLLILAIVLGVLNISLKPILKFFSFPITIATLGLFSLIVNAIVLKTGFAFVDGATLTNFSSAIIASILLSISNCVISHVLD